MLKQSLGEVMRRTGGSVGLPDLSPQTHEQLRQETKSHSQMVNVIQIVLGSLFPGQDVKLRAATRENRRVISGFWIWSMVELKHVYTDRSSVMDPKSGRDMRTYLRGVRKRNWRWKDILREYVKVLEGTSGKSEIVSDLTGDPDAEYASPRTEEPPPEELLNEDANQELG